MGLGNNTVQRIDYYVNRHESFRIGNVSAIRLNAGETPNTGILPDYLVDQLKGVVKDNDTYIVYSYRTPIGWVKLDGNDNWFIPDVKYSVSTTHHQNVLRVRTNYTTA